MLIEFGEIIVTPTFRITSMTTKQYYPGEPVNMHMKPLIHNIRENNRVISTKRVNYYYYVVMENR